MLLAGQGGADPATGKLGETIEEQTEQTLRNIAVLLEAAGCSLDDVVSCLVHLSDLSHFARYNDVYGSHFSDPKPVRTTVGADLLHGMLIEITVTARRPADRGVTTVVSGRLGDSASRAVLPVPSSAVLFRVRLVAHLPHGSGTGRASIAHYPQTVSLPARSTPSQPARRSQESAARVLVVEDEPALCDGLRTALELEGYDVEIATDGAEALEALAARPVDAVVLDVLMPRLDGIEVCRRLRTARNPVAILMLTARAEIENRVEGLDAGADDYVVKPFALDELFARLRALLRRTGDAPDAEELSFGDLELDRRRAKCAAAGERSS